MEAALGSRMQPRAHQGAAPCTMQARPQTCMLACSSSSSNVTRHATSRAASRPTPAPLASLSPPVRPSHFVQRGSVAARSLGGRSQAGYGDGGSWAAGSGGYNGGYSGTDGTSSGGGSGSGASGNATATRNRIFQTDAGSWVVAPRRGVEVKGVVHFLGGAFAGAAPQLLYSLLLDLVAASGYTAIATPYAVTFRHEQCAEAVRNQFLNSLLELRGSETMSDLVPLGAPVLGLGHSMGSHLHLLISSYNDQPYSANVLMSYNNKQVSDAIPIPGFLEALGPSMQVARAAASASPLPLPPLPTGAQALAAAAAWLPPGIREVVDGPQGGRLARAGLAIDQLSMVAGEVGDGTAGFTPSPAECRRLVATRYSIPRTLLVQFADDSIDETPEMERLLRPRVGSRGVSTLVLPGSHVTPCGGDSAELLSAVASTGASTLAFAASLSASFPDLSTPPAPGRPSPASIIQATTNLLVEQSQADVKRLGARLVGWMDAASVASAGSMNSVSVSSVTSTVASSVDSEDESVSVSRRAGSNMA